MLFLVIIYFMVFSQSVLNLFLYISNPLKHSEKVNCYNLPCNIYSIYSTLILFTIDIILLGILTYTEPLLEGIPKMWFLFYGFIGYLVIFLVHSNSKIIKRNKKLNPPDESLLNKDFRFALYMLSMVLYFTIILTRYVRNPLPVIPSKSGLDRFFWNRFGGYSENNTVNFILSYVITIAIPISVLRTLDGAKYHPTYYDLPLSWKI